MDAVTFRDWFKTSFLPHANRLEGRKALIGDNLSSHMDDDVLMMCAENDIDFICLVPNSTHLCQPLDVGFFRPMKEAWRATLSEWKLQNIKLSTVPKDIFSSLLKKTLNNMDAKPGRYSSQPRNEFDHIPSAIKRNLINSFRSSGIYPLDRQEVFKKLPHEIVEDPTAEVESALTTLLKEQRFGVSTRLQRKKKRLDVAPGCSISTATAAAANKSTANYDNEEDSDSEADIPLAQLIPMQEVDHSPIVSTSYAEEELQIEQELDNKQNHDDDQIPTRIFEVGQYVLANFSSQRGKKTYKYLCKVLEVDPEIVVMGMKSIGKSKRLFKLMTDDVSVIKNEDIIEIQGNPSEKLDSDMILYYEFETDISILEV